MCETLTGMETVEKQGFSITGGRSQPPDGEDIHVTCNACKSDGWIKGVRRLWEKPEQEQKEKEKVK